MILSLFPNLFTYQLIGIFILRIALGLTFIRQGYRIAKAIDWAMIVIGIMLLIGLYTQIVAVVAALMMLSLVVKEIRQRQFDNLNYHLLVLAISLAFLTLGAGAFAIDLPL